MAILQVSLILSAGEGELFAWGKNRVGTLGLAHNKDQFFPFKVSAAILFDALITHQTLWSFYIKSSIWVFPFWRELESVKPVKDKSDHQYDFTLLTSSINRLLVVIAGNCRQLLLAPRVF